MHKKKTIGDCNFDKFVAKYLSSKNLGVIVLVSIVFSVAGANSPPPNLSDFQKTQNNNMLLEQTQYNNLANNSINSLKKLIPPLQSDNSSGSKGGGGSSNQNGGGGNTQQNVENFINQEKNKYIQSGQVSSSLNPSLMMNEASNQASPNRSTRSATASLPIGININTADNNNTSQ